MSKVEIDRRKFIISTLGCIGALALENIGFSKLTLENELYVSPQQSKDGKFFIGLIDLTSFSITSIPIPFLAHSIIQDPKNKNHIVAFSHEPGHQSCLIDIKEKNMIHLWEADYNNYFYGHGAFGIFNDYLFSAESDYKTNEGIITVRDKKDYKLLGTLSSYGVDPHELRSSPDGRTLIIANCGTTRISKNSVLSNVTFVDITSGRLKMQFNTSNRFQSFRHMHVFEDGSVGLCLQLQNKMNESPLDVNLIAFIQNKFKLLIEMENKDNLFSSTLSHSLSIVGVKSKSVLGVTHPFQNVVSFWDTGTGKLRMLLPVHKPVGIAVTSNQKHFIITSSGVEKDQNVYSFPTHLSGKVVPIHQLRNPHKWATHLTRIQV